VGVVVLNYRTPRLVLDCLESLAPELRPGEVEALVVDNASADGSAERLRAELARRPWPVGLVEAAENRGFAAGNNLGIRSLDAEAFLLLNSDTLVRPGAVARLRKALEADPRVGIVGPRLEWPDGEPQISAFRAHTPWSQLISASSLEIVRRALARFEVSLPLQSQEAPAWVSFAAVLIRRQLLEEVGPLDERYFMYFEDADLCLRAGRRGWKVVQEPAARVVHLRGGTSPVKRLTAAGERRPAYYYAARRHYFRSQFGPWGLLAANLLWTLGWSLSLVRRALGGPRRTVRRELRDNWGI